jgi:hypothetical protein
MDLSIRARAAAAILDVAALGFNPRQRRGPDGRWVDTGGAGVAGGRRGASARSGQRGGPPQARNNAEAPQRDLVQRLRRVVKFDEEEKGFNPTSYMAEVAQKLEQALDNDDQAEIARWEKRALATVETQERMRGLDETQSTDGVARGKLGFRALMLHQRDRIRGKLSREQVQDGLEQYLSNPRGYKAINEVARAETAPPFASMTKAQQERVRQLDRIVSVFDEDATTLEQDAEVWRGVRDPGSFLGDLKPGMEFVDNAPVSTSMDKSWATEFVTSFGGKGQRPENNAILKIRVKAGQKGLVANSITGEFDTKVGWEQEREMLLPPGTRFRVVGKAEDTDAGGKKIPTYEVEVVDTPVQPPRAPAKRKAGKAEEPGRNLKKSSDLPIFDRIKALDLVKKIRNETGVATNAPEIQEQLVEAIKAGIDLNTRSAKLLLKDFNKYGGV